ncbi:MAG: prolipoprotein diacylglyceryl transferase [Myxococcaceae bacterium]|nr:prolipoprotein diacylglyceryl transferase [Myxococcaceae bacterium]
MWPIVAELEIAGLSRPLTSYGLCAILGVLLGSALIGFLARRRGFPLFEALAACALGVGFGLLGAKLLFLAVSLPKIAVEGIGPYIESGGFVFYGGLIVGSAAVIAYLRLIRLPALDFADVVAPGLALGHALGRVGCFLMGCCHGRPTDLPFGVRFPKTPFFAGPTDTPLHPVQLYEAAFELALTGLLLGLCLGRRTRRFSGDVFALWCAGYGSFRLIAELFWRGDDRGLGTRVLPPSALISLLLIAAAIGFAWRGRHSARLKTSGQTSP